MYKHLVLGGTFDGLHRGHTSFLNAAFAQSLEVTIGLTSEAYVRRFKKGKGVTPFSKRYEALTSWLRKNNHAGRTHIFPLDNAWGAAILGEYDAIAVTPDNKSMAEQINDVRKERGISPLSIVLVPLIDATDLQPISSSRVREGIIDTEGHLRMPDSLRPELQAPLGKILDSSVIQKAVQKNRDSVIITVGDVTTQTVFLCGVKPALAIIDLHVERKPFQTLEQYKFPRHYSVVRLVSGPGYIAKGAIDAIISWVGSIRQRKRMVLVIDGEEDLLTLPVIFHAPIGSIVYYGQPPKGDRGLGTYTEGLVEVVVTDETKEIAKNLLSRFVVS
jgi:pantetheine-phosphate adenylyltransferase